MNMGYTPLTEYGIIGNDDRMALVDLSGSIDWCCFPHAAGPSVFARLLDDERGGHFAVRPTDSYEVEQAYRDRTNVLETTFSTRSGTLEVTDFMPVWRDDDREHDGDQNHDDRDQRAIYRRVRCTDGTLTVELEFEPRFEYGQAPTTVSRTETGYVATGDSSASPDWIERQDDLVLEVCGEFEPNALEDRVVGTRTLVADDEVWFCLRYGVGGRDGEGEEEGEGKEPQRQKSASIASCRNALESTVDYWQSWTDSLIDDAVPLVDDTPWGEYVLRSGLVLKLLINEETGGIYAAATTSLPEKYGTDRNWDYRYNWIRDAKFTVQALHNLGRDEEARDYFEWFRDIVTESPGEMQPVYGVHGEADLTEHELEGLSGYRHSTPIRIGNAAATQNQHDIYGAIVQAIYETLVRDGDLDDDEWEAIEALVDHVCAVWAEPDHGIWEYRDEQRHYVHSKLLCWVALERGITLAEDHDVEAPLERWRSERRAVREAILEHGYSERVGSFVQHFDTDTALDASCLLIPLYGFLPPDDPRVTATLDTVLDELATDEGLVYRTKGSEAVPDVHGTFVFCTCWLVDALVLADRIDAAEDIFHTVLEHASPLGLLSERIEPETGELLGNFPQAFSHIGLVNSAIYLASARGEADELNNDPRRDDRR